MPRPFDPLLSVVVPCFNEQEVIRATHQRLTLAVRETGVDYEIVYVDDGSRDRTSEILNELQTQDAHVRVVRFSRNFGHQVAVTAGMDYATGDAVVLIDADLQDPPELIAEFLACWRNGADVAYGRRTEREGETVFKRVTASLFYRFLHLVTEVEIPSDTGDFRLMDRSVVEALRRMPERDRFIRGMVSWVGFRQVAVPYRREARFAGSSKYPVGKMLRLAADAITAFSNLPARLPFFAGLATAAAAMIAFAAFVGLSVAGADGSLAALILTAVLGVGGLQLLSIGLLCEYVGRVYRQVQGRPLYVVAESDGAVRRDGTAIAA